MDHALRPLARFVGFPLVYALAVAAGRATRIDGQVSLVWPAAAVGIIWLLSVRHLDARQRLAHVALLGATAFVANIVTGADPTLSTWFSGVNIVLSVVTVELLVRGRDRVALRDPADLGRLVAAVTAGTCTAALLATTWFAVVEQDPVFETFALFAVRNGATALIGVAVWLRLRDMTVDGTAVPRVASLAAVEGVLIGVSLVAVFGWVFWMTAGVPIAFIAFVPTIWLALRATTTASTLTLTAAGVWIVVATLCDRGPFVHPDPHLQALLAQAMVASLTMIVLTLSLFRDSRARLIAELKEARDAADRDSDLLGAVLDSIHDSVLLLDGDGRVVLRNAQAAQSGMVDAVVSSIRDDGGDPPAQGHRDLTVDGDGGRVLELASAPLARQPSLNVVAFRDVTDERRTARELRDARDLFAGVLDAALEQAIIGTDPDGRITVFNRGAERLLGWSQAEMVGRSPLDFHYFPEVRARAAELGVQPGFEVFIHNVAPEEAEVREWTYVRRDGSTAVVSLAVSRMSDYDGALTGWIGVATDITEKKIAEHALADSEERFRLAFDTAPMGMYMFAVTEPDAGRITRCNQAMADFLGRSIQDLLGMAVADLGSGAGAYLADIDSAATVDVSRIVCEQPGGRFEGELPCVRADGKVVWAAVSASLVAPEGSAPYGICLVENITDRKHAEAELQFLALHDSLTGLANRVLIAERIDLALSRNAGAGVGVIFLDLDGFKQVNDTWGHAEGDALLVEVARRIRRAIRSGDTAARLGGDEFAVLCTDIPDVECLHALGERIRTAVGQPITLTSGGMYSGLTVSVGAVESWPGCDASTLLRRADQVMYQAKRTARGAADHAQPISDTAR